MDKQKIYISIVFVVAIIAIGMFLMSRKVSAPVQQNTPTTSATTTPVPVAKQDKSFSLKCDAQKTLKVTFHIPADNSVEVVLSDGRSMSLANVSVSGKVEYANANKSALLDINGPQMSLTEGKTVTYANCTSGPVTPPAKK